MWQRFTERARLIVFRAQDEARRCGSNDVETEHLLLGLFSEKDAVAVHILVGMGVDLRSIRDQVEQQLTKGESRSGKELQLAPRTKRVIDLAYEEARQLANNYIGTEHLLLGLLREKEGLAGRVLAASDVELERVREEVKKLQSGTARPEKGALEHIKRTPGREGPLEKGEALRIGDLGTLQPSGSAAQVELCVLEDSCAALAEVMEAKDEVGYRQLVHAGSIQILPAGIEAKLLRLSANGACYVRLLTGDHAGHAGWVLPTTFRRTGPDTRPFPPPLTPGT